MKLKTIFKFFLTAIVVVTAASCINSYGPTVERTEADELSLLNEYIDTLQNRGFDVDTTAMGVYYVVDSAGTGAYPLDGDTCIVKYEGVLLSSGYFFDTSAAHNPTDSTFQFVLGVDNMIPGWTDGMRVINKGAQVYLIIPSELAYGSDGAGYMIGPYETLIFKINMVDIKQAY